MTNVVSKHLCGMTRGFLSGLKDVVGIISSGNIILHEEQNKEKPSVHTEEQVFEFSFPAIVDQYDQCR